MKPFLIILCLITFSSGCRESSRLTLKTAESAVPSPASTSTIYIVDTISSVLRWEGYQGLSLGKSAHNGTVSVSGGNIYVDNSMIQSGAIQFDLKSISVSDIPITNPKNSKLTKHLMSEDFLDISRFPQSEFVITGIIQNKGDSIMVSGNLTLKGITRNISFSTSAIVTDSMLSVVSPRFYIDRKDWGMYYKTENSLGDRLIRPEVGIIVKIIARRQAFTQTHAKYIPVSV